MSKTEVSGKQLKDGSVELVDLAPEVSGVLNTLQSDVATLQTDVAAKADAGNLAAVATSGSYDDLSDKPTIPSLTQVESDIGSLDARVTAVEGDVASLEASAFSGSYTDLTNKPSLFSGSYTDLTDKPTIPSISGLATETYVDTAVAGVVNSAPAVLDTLNELAAALGNDENFATTVAGQIGDVASDVSAIDTRVTAVESDVAALQSATAPDLGDLGDVSITTPSNGQVLKYNGTGWVNAADSTFSGSYTDLTNKPTIPSAIDDLSDVTITSAANNQFLKFNGSAWVNSALPVASTTTSGVVDTGFQIFAGEKRFSSNIQVGASIIGAGATLSLAGVTGGTTTGASITITGNTNDGSMSFGTKASIYGGIVARATINTAGLFSALYGAFVESGAAATKGLVVKGAASQTANVFEVQASNGGAYLYVNNNHTVFMQSTAASEKVLIVRSSSNGTSAGDGHALDIQNGWGNTVAYVKPTGSAYFSTTLASVTPLTVKGAASQTANLLEVQNSSGTALFSVDKDGSVSAGTVPVARVTGLATVATSGSYNDLSDKPTIPSLTQVESDISSLDTRVTAVEADVASLQSASAPNLSDLGEVSITSPSSGQVLKYNGTGWANAADSTFSGSYTDLTDKPTLFSGSYTDLTDKPTLFDGAYSSLTGAPSLATVATSGSYADLSNKPTIPSALDDLSDVTISSPSTDQVLKYNGTAWVNSAAPAAGATNLDGLSDVVVTSPASGHHLRYNGTSWVNAAIPASDLPVAQQSSGIIDTGFQIFSGDKRFNGIIQAYGGVAAKAPAINQPALRIQPAGVSQSIPLIYLENTSGGAAFTVNTTGASSIILSSASAKGLVIQGAASQSANLFEAQNSSGTALVSISSAGTVHATRYTEAVANAFNTSLAPSSGTLTVDTSVGNAVLGALNASVATWAFTNVPTENGKVTTVSAIVAGNTTYTYGSACSVNGSAVATGVQWFGGTAPTASSSTDVLTFVIVKDSAGTIRVLGSSQTVDSVVGSASAGIDGAGSANYLSKWTDANTIANSAIYETGGNVGINTTSPANRLDVVGGRLVSRGSSADAISIVEAQVNDYWSASTYKGTQIATHGGSATGTTVGISNANLGLLCFQNTANALIYTNGSTPIVFGTSSTERMRIDSSGCVGIGTASSTDTRLLINGTSTSNSTYALTVRNSTSGILFYARNDGLINTGLQAQSPYNATTASAANLVVDANGSLLRSTSSLKYKTDVQNATHGLNEVLELRPVTYKGNNDGDKVFGGLIAEEVHDAGLTEFVQYAADGTPDALAYGNMVSLAFKAIQELNAKVDALQAEKEALEARLAALENN